MPTTRHARRVVLLARTAIWCWVVSMVLMALIYRGQTPPTIIGVPMAVTTIAIGLLTLSALVIHGLTGGTWQFSLRALLIVMTLVAVVLGAAVWAARN